MKPTVYPIDNHEAKPLVVVRRLVSDLHADPANVNRHGDVNLRAISDSLRTFGQVEPLVVQKGTGKVIGGNGRLEVLARDGATEVDVVELDIDDTKAAALGIALNRTAKTSEFDDGALAKVLASLPTELQLGAGFAEEDLAAALAGIDAEPIDAPELATGDREPFRQMTFVVSDEQHGDIEAAIKAAKDAAPFVETGNENSNGNALHRMAEDYLGRR